MATKTAKKPAPSTTKKPAASTTVTAGPAAKPAAAAKTPAKAAKAPAKTAAATTKPAVQKTAAAPAKTAAKPATKAAAAPAQAAVKPAAKPAPVKTGKWDEIRTLLMDMKQATLREISRSIKSGSEANIGEETTGDIYDQASSERDRELELILSDRERQKLHNIDEALLRMDDDEYGICEECDEEIPLGRLKAMPFTRHCVKCKSDLERLQAQTRRFEEDRAYREIPLGDDEEA